MLTTDGPKVIEFNVRLGDPESQVILPLIDEPLLPILVAAATGSLRQRTVRLADERLAGVVLASRGYPESAESGQPIEGIDRAEAIPRCDRLSRGHREARRTTRHIRRTSAHGRWPRERFR